MITHFDHVYSFLRDNDLDATLTRFQQAGFVPLEQKVRHATGFLTGFVDMTGTYLEFLSVVDESEYEAEATLEDRIFRKYPKPFAIGAVCNDPEEIYLRLKPSYPKMKPPHNKAPQDNPTGPHWWTFCPLPNEATSGLEIFALKYLKRKNHIHQHKQGPNSIFGFTGITLVSDQIAHRMETWEKTLSLSCTEVRKENTSLYCGPQRFNWITMNEYERRFGQNWIKHETPCGEIGAVELSAESPETAAQYFEKAGFKIIWDQNCFRTQRDEKTGYTFLVRQGNPQEFLQYLNR